MSKSLFSSPDPIFLRGKYINLTNTIGVVEVSYIHNIDNYSSVNGYTVGIDLSFTPTYGSSVRYGYGWASGK